MVNSPLDNVNELLRLGFGDTYRLEDIKQRLANGKVLYASDNDYLQKLVYQYRGEIQKVVEHKKPEPTLEPQREPTPEPQREPTPEPQREPKREPTPEPKREPQPKKKSSKKKKLGIFIGAVVFLYFGLSIIGGAVDTSTSTPSSEIVNEPVVLGGAERAVLGGAERAELTNSAIDWTYKDIVRNPEKYSGEILSIYGEVQHVQNEGNDRYFLVMEKKCGAHPYNLICDYAVIDYSGTRILEGDYINSWGTLSEILDKGPYNGKPSPLIKSLLLDCDNCN